MRLLHLSLEQCPYRRNNIHQSYHRRIICIKNIIFLFRIFCTTRLRCSIITSSTVTYCGVPVRVVCTIITEIVFNTVKYSYFHSPISVSTLTQTCAFIFLLLFRSSSFFFSSYPVLHNNTPCEYAYLRQKFVLP